jgi:hypothetical protein
MWALFNLHLTHANNESKRWLASRTASRRFTTCLLFISLIVGGDDYFYLIMHNFSTLNQLTNCTNPLVSGFLRSRRDKKPSKKKDKDKKKKDGETNSTKEEVKSDA